ncbi:hypothetical protein DPEC_G00119410 [Dallia pectoralis]|uniref:Uncharacterized protein n=1 Tax=Dallia pectoralis TaxID=75939 RepID=A0ACC2GPC0_DALPE|nr:hypothetical protein DPEC_G00119410 [Dallia pectoralis]
MSAVPVLFTGRWVHGFPRSVAPEDHSPFSVDQYPDDGRLIVGEGGNVRAGVPFPDVFSGGHDGDQSVSLIRSSPLSL